MQRLKICHRDLGRSSSERDEENICCSTRLHSVTSRTNALASSCAFLSRNLLDVVKLSLLTKQRRIWSQTNRLRTGVLSASYKIRVARRLTSQRIFSYRVNRASLINKAYSNGRSGCSERSLADNRSDWLQQPKQSTPFRADTLLEGAACCGGLSPGLDVREFCPPPSAEWWVEDEPPSQTHHQGALKHQRTLCTESRIQCDEYTRPDRHFLQQLASPISNLQSRSPLHACCLAST